MNKILLFGTTIIPILLFSQIKKIYLFDQNNIAINRFEAEIYTKDTLVIVNKKTNNFFKLDDRRIDSIKINYNGFYNKIIKQKIFKEIDTIYLKDVIPLNEIILTAKTSIEITTLNKKIQHIK